MTTLQEALTKATKEFKPEQKKTTQTLSNNNLYKNRVSEIANRLCIGYQFDDYNKPAFSKLFEYFTNDKEFENNPHGWKLSKGICLIGNIGSGKTLAMRIFQTFLIGTKQYFNIESAMKIERKFATEGWEGINLYMHNPTRNDRGYLASEPRHLCIDDLGTETGETVSYGAKHNVIRQLLYERREYLVGQKVKTHATTNAKKSALNEFYGDRLYSRMEEMFNFMKFDSKTDRRKAL